MQVKRWKGWRMSYDVGDVTERLENEQSSSITSLMSQLILQPFHCFTYVTALSPTLPLLHLHHSSFSNLSVTSPTSQLILQPFSLLTQVTAHSPTLPLLHLHHSSFSNSSFVSSTSPGEPPMIESFIRSIYLSRVLVILLVINLYRFYEYRMYWHLSDSLIES